MAADAIDIHTHIVPARFPPYSGDAAAARWPEMTPALDCRHANVVIAGKVFRTVTDECWDVDRRVEAMALSRITRQVLSPMPELLSYWLAVDDAVALGCHVNETIAEMVNRAPDQFSGLGMVPLQKPERAARELERLMATNSSAEWKSARTSMGSRSAMRDSSRSSPRRRRSVPPSSCTRYTRLASTVWSGLLWSRLWSPFPARLLSRSRR